MAVYSDEHIEFYDRKKTENTMNTIMSDAHFHDKHELYYLEKGKTKYFVGNEIFLLEQGDLLFVPEGEIHKTDSTANPEVERMLFVFNDSFAGNEYISYIQELKINKHVRLPKDQIYKLKEIFHKIEMKIKRRVKII